MRQFFISLFASIIGFFIALILIFILLIGIGGAIASMSKAKKPDSKSLILSLNLHSPMLDHGGDGVLFGKKPMSLVKTVRALDKAKSDKKIKGLFIRANGWALPPAQAEELRAAIKDFQTSGKFVITHAQGFEGTGLSAYMAIAPSDEIWLQDTTGFALAGQRAEVEFLGGVFEKFDAKPQFIQFYEYKNAANIYTEKTFTRPHRESMTSLLKSIADSSVANIAKDRKIKPDEFWSFLDNAPHSAEQAKEYGLVDKLGHVDDAKQYAKEKAGEGSEFLPLDNYGVSSGSGPVIAFVGGQGPVVMGSSESGDNPFSNKVMMGGDTLSEALIKASKDDKVKAIILRINSPGGSATASDQIWDAVVKAKKAGKPVVVSMGQYAASGGYYVAAPADKIIAWPTTITGSIGVLGGIINIRNTTAKIGHNVEAINIGGEFAAAYSFFEPWNQNTRQAMYNMMQDIYTDFTTKVAQGRGLKLEKVKEIAKGRVWTGAQAKSIGLVDELGGFMKALETAKELAKIDKDTKVRIKKFPRELTDMEKLERMFSVTAEAVRNMEDLQALTSSPEYQAYLKARAQMSERGIQMKADLPQIK